VADLGGALGACCLQLGSLNEECAKWYTAEIVVALEHMHAQGIVHRDLKPGTPFLTCTAPVPRWVKGSPLSIPLPVHTCREHSAE
jgi:3-phosphoinositide dependent protein kinase-1